MPQIRKSVIDGLMIVNGGFIINVVLFITMISLMAGRLPEYPGDEQRTSRAQLVFYGLLLYHISFAVVRYLSQWFTHAFRIYQSIFIFATVYLLAYILQDWVYRPDRDHSTMDYKQQTFELWLDLEIILTYSYVMTGILYALLRSIKRPPMIARPAMILQDTQDFMESNAMMIELISLVFATPLIGTLQKVVFPNDHYIGYNPGSYSRTMIASGWAQAGLLCVGIFMTQASASRSESYNKVMPQVLWYVNMVAMFVMPFVVAGFAIAEMVEEGKAMPYLLLSALIQLGFFIWSITDWKNAMIDHNYDRATKDALAVRTLEARCGQLNLQEEDTEDDDDFKKVRTGKLEQIRFKEHFERLKKPLPNETEQAKEEAEEFLKQLLKPYNQQFRDNDDGKIRVGTILELSEDYYSYTFIHQLKRKSVYGEGGDSDGEEEPDKKVDDDKDGEGDEQKQFAIQTPYTVHSSHRISVTAKLLLLIVSQLILLGYMISESVSDGCMLETLTQSPESVKTVIGRFVCAFIMHTTLTNESNQGLNMMKYASNHHWRFRNWLWAYFIGFCQFSVLVTCEAANLIILTTNHSMLDIIMNFLAIIVITEFDDAFFFMVQGEELASILTNGEVTFKTTHDGEEKKRSAEEVLPVIVTTADGARMKLDENRLRPNLNKQVLQDQTAIAQNAENDEKEFENEPEYIFIDIRTWGNFFARCWYKVCLVFFASVWYYFVPFYSLVLSYWIPAFFGDKFVGACEG